MAVVPCLVWDSPQGRQVFDLDRAVLILGRDEVADVQILETSVSRRHALMQVENGTVKLTDLGSSSGTRINGAKLVPDLPSSVDPGDFVQLGRVTMTFHASPPPVKKAPPAARPSSGRPPPSSVAAPPRRRAPAPENPDRWKLIALVFAFIVVAGLGAVIALLATRDDPPAPEPEQAKAEPEAKAVEPKIDPPPKVVPQPPPVKPTENLAPEGELPPRGFVSPRDYPDLIEFDYSEYYPVRLLTWDGSRLKAVGADGRTYSIPQNKVTKGENRVDLARRAARSRAQLDPEDADAHLELARWCAKRYIRTETRSLSKRVLELRPNDPEATSLLRSTK